MVEEMGVCDKNRQHKEERYEVYDNIAHTLSGEQFVEQLRVNIEEQQKHHDVLMIKSTFTFILFYLSDDEF